MCTCGWRVPWRSAYNGGMNNIFVPRQPRPLSFLRTVIVVLVVIFVLCTIILTLLSNGRESPQSGMPMMRSIVPVATACIDGGSRITRPVPGTPICENDSLVSDTWPTTWRDCNDGILWFKTCTEFAYDPIVHNANSPSFSYSATYGNKRITCTITGCTETPLLSE